jgi:hypothetical protein
MSCLSISISAYFFFLKGAGAFAELEARRLMLNKARRLMLQKAI